MWAEDFPETKGIYEKTFTLQSGTLMRYTLHIPKSFSFQKEIPLIIALHYGGTVSPWYGKGFLTILVKPALAKLGAIIVAPDCPGHGWGSPTAASAVIALIKHIKQHYTINNKQVLLTGFSMGGIGTWYIASRYPEFFSAAIPISGMAEQETIDMFPCIPLHIIHSNADEIFPIKPVEEMVKKLKSKGIPVKLTIVKGISHYHTADFVRSLKKTIPWIKQIWEKKE